MCVWSLSSSLVVAHVAGPKVAERRDRSGSSHLWSDSSHRAGLEWPLRFLGIDPPASIGVRADSRNVIDVSRVEPSAYYYYDLMFVCLPALCTYHSPLLPGTAPTVPAPLQGEFACMYSTARTMAPIRPHTFPRVMCRSDGRSVGWLTRLVVHRYLQVGSWREFRDW